MKKIIYPIILLIILFFGAKGYYRFLNSPVDKNGEVKAFVITRGEATDSIAKRLESEGLIRSPLAFKINLKLSGKAGKIAAGNFKLSSAMSVDQIINNL